MEYCKYSAIICVLVLTAIAAAQDTCSTEIPNSVSRLPVTEDFQNSSQSESSQPPLFRPPSRISNPWDHIADYFDDFETQVAALNVDFCRQSCNFSYKADVLKRHSFCDACSCSDTCEETGNCCPDLILLHNKTQVPVIPGCIESELPVTIYTKFYSMISSCPESFNGTRIKTSCEEPSYTDWSSIVPHFNIDSGTLFRNIFCAQCHGQNNTRSCNTSITCSSFDSTLQDATSLLALFNATMESKPCRIQFSPPFYSRHKCKRRVGAVIEQCNVTGLWKHYDKKVARACTMFSHVVFGTYRNIFCYYCNNWCGWQYLLDLKSVDGLKDITVVSLTALINFDNTMEYEPYTDIESNVNSRTSMVEYLEQCQNMSVSCPDGKRLVNDQCQSLISSTNMYGYRVCFQSNITNSNQLTSIDGSYFTFIWPTTRGGLHSKNVTAFVLEIQNCPDKEMYVVVRYVMFVFWLFPTNRDDFERRLMDDDLILTTPGVQFLAGCDDTLELAIRQGDPSSCTSQFTKFVIPFMSSVLEKAVDVSSGAEYIQLNRQLICPRIELRASDYVFVTHNNTLYSGINKYLPSIFVLRTQTVLEHDKFQKSKDGSVVICIGDYLNTTFITSSSCDDVTRDSTGHVEQTVYLGLFSFVCTLVSLLFLAMTFITYCIFSSMRTVGGVCNMGLIATVFAAQTVFEFGAEQNEDVVGCIIIGIFIHFLWIAAVFWMNACTFLVFLKLSFPLKCLNFVYNRTKLFCLSALYANGSSAVIVCLNIIINFAWRDDIGYGGNICYLNTMSSKIYFFKVPMGVIVIINVGLFVFTICRIRHHGSIGSSRESKINLIACVKLSVITGLVWLFSYLYEVFQITAFAYIFTLFVGAQGVLFFVAIVMNRNVWSRWLSFLGKNKQVTSSKQTKSDSLRALNQISCKIQEQAA